MKMIASNILFGLGFACLAAFLWFSVGDGDRGISQTSNDFTAGLIAGLSIWVSYRLLRPSVMALVKRIIKGEAKTGQE